MNDQKDEPIDPVRGAQRGAEPGGPQRVPFGSDFGLPPPGATAVPPLGPESLTDQRPPLGRQTGSDYGSPSPGSPNMGLPPTGRRPLFGAPLGSQTGPAFETPADYEPATEPPPPGRLRRARTRIRRTAPFVATILATFVAIAAYGALNPGPHLLDQGDVKQAIASALASVTPPPAYSTIVFQQIHPSLVLIQTDSTDSTGKAQNALGTGVVIDQAGEILTALHVVADATTIHLTFADGSKSTATVTTRTPESDIAVLQPDTPPATIVPATLGNPGALRIGDDAYVVGNPLGLYGSMSAGVVSGLDRTFQVPDSTQTLTGLIQVDAAVNPGNSGGPLLNRDGQVVGIVTGLINPTKQDVFIGIGLAVPIDVAGGAAGLPPY